MNNEENPPKMPPKAPKTPKVARKPFGAFGALGGALGGSLLVFAACTTQEKQPIVHRGPIAGQGDPYYEFDLLVDQYYEFYSSIHPSSATELGLHDHDHALDDESPAAIQRETERLHAFARRFAELDPRWVKPADRHDLAFVRSASEASLLELERIQGWKHHPDAYPGIANGAIYALVKRASTPERERLENVIRRTEKIPALLEQGKKNLEKTPKVCCEIALEDLEGIPSFFEKDVPAAFPNALQGDAAERWKKACTGAIAAFKDYETFVKEKLLPEAPEAFALGAELFREKLKREEMIETPLDELLARGEAELKRLQEEYRKVAAKVDPDKPFREVQATLGKDHATADRVIPETQARLGKLRAFLVEKEIVTIPSELMPKVEETPAFMRAMTLASMSTPGPFEKVATDAIFDLTLPDPSWKPEKSEEYLAGALSRTTLDITAIHEALPGHFIQFLWLPLVKSTVRKYEGASSNVEGWAHYCEQMLLDEGWGEGDARLRLAQLQDALLRAARYVAGIRMHTKGMSVEDAARLFREEGYQSETVSSMEAHRGVEDPTYLYYTWGKLEILQLREDYKKKLGASYSLKKFHDALLAEGTLPLPLVREALLR